MKKRTLNAISIGLSIAILSGCAQKTESNIIFTGQDGALNELKSISIEARDELRILAKAQESKSQQGLTKEQHNQRFFQATHVPDGFGRRLDFSYTGPASKAAEAVAMMAGYKFKIYGKPLSQEPWVRIVLVNQPLNDGLKELGLQTGDSILVEVHSAAKLMRFVYKNQ
jgi:hypothetical protein